MNVAFVARRGDNFCSCEMLVGGSRIGVERGGVVYVKKEEDVLKRGHIMRLESSQSAERHILALAKRFEGVPFSALGHYTLAVLGRGWGLARRWDPEQPPRAFVCANLVTILLQSVASMRMRSSGALAWAEVVGEMDASTATPSSLFRALSRAIDAKLVTK